MTSNFREPSERSEHGGHARINVRVVGDFMSSPVHTLNENETTTTAAKLMDDKHVRHVPIVRDKQLVGILTYRALLRQIGLHTPICQVDALMKKDVVTVDSSTPCLDAIELMNQSELGCLPIVDSGELVGIVTETDFISISAALLQEWLSE